jgi:hypothetical protein
MTFTEFIYLAVFSIFAIFVGKYMYDLMYTGNNAAISTLDALDETPLISKEEYVGMEHDTLEIPQPIPPTYETADGTTPLECGNGAAPAPSKRIPMSESSRAQQGPAMQGEQDMSVLRASGIDQGAQYEPVQLLNPLPNDRLMPISGSKDDPIKTRLDTAETMGLYQHILEKDMGQNSSNTSNKNRFFEMGPRDSAYHLNGSAGTNAFDQQCAFHGEQPKHRNFDLGFEINYKKQDQELAATKQKISSNLLSPFLQ